MQAVPVSVLCNPDMTQHMQAKGWHYGFAIASQDSPLAHEAAQFKAQHPMSDEEPQMADWNGGIGSAQLGWLNEQLALAKLSGERVIVACHHQIGGGATACLYLFVLHSDACRRRGCRQRLKAILQSAVPPSRMCKQDGTLPLSFNCA